MVKLPHDFGRVIGRELDRRFVRQTTIFSALVQMLHFPRLSYKRNNLRRVAPRRIIVPVALALDIPNSFGQFVFYYARALFSFRDGQTPLRLASPHLASQEG